MVDLVYGQEQDVQQIRDAVTRPRVERSLYQPRTWPPASSVMVRVSVGGHRRGQVQGWPTLTLSSTSPANCPPCVGSLRLCPMLDIVNRYDLERSNEIIDLCQEPDLDRPVAGHVNICPNNLDNPKELTENIKHEILHVLGFSVKLYAFFRDRSGKPR